jgi:hypothetical protein
MEDDVDAPDGVDSHGDVDIERHGDDEVEEDQQEEHEEEEVQDEDDGKVPWMIGQGEMVNTSPDDVDTIVDGQPIVLPEQGQGIRKHTPWPQPPVRAPRPQTLERRPPLRIPETYPLTGLELLGVITLQKTRLAVPTFQGVEAAGNTTDVDVNQQVLIELAGSDCLSDFPLSKVSLPDVSLPNVPHPEARPDGSVGVE